MALIRCPNCGRKGLSDKAIYALCGVRIAQVKA